MANHYTSTHPRSHFTQGPLVIRHDPEHGVRHVLRGREWTIRRGADVETRAVASSAEALPILAEHFGLEFPEGTRFRGLDPA